MVGTFDFEPVRPYNDSEVPAAIEAITKDVFFPMVVKYCAPEANVDEVIQMFSQIKTVRDFQSQVMHAAINAIIKKTTDGVSSDGFEKLDNRKRHMFIANHRDIVLDSAILDVLLFERGIDTCQITFGSNLMKGNLVVNIGKLNKMFRIIRGGNIKDFYKNSVEVSAYMRYAITELHDSVWIAQRNGRTKDGNDKTEVGVLKMFSLSSEKAFVDNLDELSIAPISVSYEYEPCDFLKTAELYISRFQKYIKGENEDLNSILTGIKQPKGRIHISVTDPITREELEICDKKEKNDKLVALASLIDQRIYKGFKLFKTHFIAYDLLYGDTYTDRYTAKEKNDFIAYMNEGLSKLGEEMDRSELEQIFLHIYANPVLNCLSNEK
ncbi:MAG: acyltransferase [Paludibacteraceae bacterium]|nr:acyltransferase [Paludibacteraceae bacterium]